MSAPEDTGPLTHSPYVSHLFHLWDVVVTMATDSLTLLVLVSV